MYKFKYGGKTGTSFQLVEAKELVVVRTDEAAPLASISMSRSNRSLTASMVPVVAFPEANVTVYRCMDTIGRSAVATRNAVRRELPEEENIRFAGRALKDAVTGEVVVYTENLYIQFQASLGERKCAFLISERGLMIKEQLEFAPNAFFVKALEGTGLKVFDIAAELLQLPEVLYCHPELVRQRRKRALHPMQWHLRPTDIGGTHINQHVNVETAWQLAKGAGTTIAIVDDGVDIDHEEFSTPGKVVAPRDAILNTSNPRHKHFAEGHGTCCAGVACADGKKASGVAPEAKLLPIRIGSLNSISEAKAFAWAAEHGADVISCSWGPEDGRWDDPNDPRHFSLATLPDSTRTAIEFALQKGRNGKGCVIVWAAGNGNEDVKFDEYASHPAVIAVAACNDSGSRSIYSDFGEAIWCSFPSSDIDAPEFNHPRPLTPGIWTADRTGPHGDNPGGNSVSILVGDKEGNYTAEFGGTSSACPGVAGIAALMLSANPTLTSAQVKEIIKNSCDRIDETGGGYNASGHSPKYGFGRINAQRAVENALAAAQPEGVETFANGLARFNKNNNVPIQNGEPVGGFVPTQRLLGFQLRLEPFHPEIQVVYKCVIKNLGESIPGRDGSYSGTKDKRRSLVGISIALEGPLAANFRVKYEVRTKTGMAAAQDGAWCGSDKPTRGKAIEGLTVTVERVA